MSGEELAGPPAPKLLRLLYFVGAGFICTVGINKWRELQRKSILQQQQQQLPENAANALE
ncbi:PREDICTED: transmembrane [Prunus dulcis]|uniref:PREDICTED: transmembrane n=1 Tax=Prunus dulcis TaxID=3755 RepID=A0A5E4EV58_PRUDU|nr:PREDICTED: transmembrane [Prunus dulcis]